MNLPPAHTPAKTDLLLEKAGEFVRQLLHDKLPRAYYFHDIKYTEQVYNAASQLAGAAGLEEEDRKNLLLAALFSGTGYTVSYDQPEESSIAIAREFLSANKIPGVADVTKILGSELTPVAETTPLQRLYIDARNSYLGQKGFSKRLRRLRKQQEELTGQKLEILAWLKGQINKVSNHIFLTRHGEELFGIRKTKNLKKLKKTYKNTLKIVREREKTTSVSANSGARTLFKTALRNHIDLTNIADQKANIMLSINALIITIGLPAFSTYLSDTRHLIIPAAIFLLTSVAAMIIATLSTRPIKTDGKTDLSKLLSGKTNLFFFGNFYKMKNEDYQKAIRQIVAQREYLDSSFINDLFYLGKALGYKFRLLRFCYTVFVGGVMLSVVAFILTYLFNL